MNGSGCKNCPVKPCETMNYRGSACAAQRAKFGLGDPKTNADRIREMSDEELAKRLIFWNDDWGRWETDAGNIEGDPRDTQEEAIKAELAWLQQPAEG